MGYLVGADEAPVRTSSRVQKSRGAIRPRPVLPKMAPAAVALMVLTILSAAVAAVVLLFGEHVFYRDLQAVASAKYGTLGTWRDIVDNVESGDITCGDEGFQLKLEPLTAKEGIEMVVPLGTPVGAIKRPTPISIQDPYCRVPFGKPKGSYFLCLITPLRSYLYGGLYGGCMIEHI